MSRPREAGPRRALPLALLASAACAAVLSGCSSPAGHASSSGGAAAGASAAPSARSGAAQSASYRLAAPAAIGGWKLTQPSADTLAKMKQGLGQAEQTVGGLSGTPVFGLYDDTADQAWVVFVGLNGSGYDPSVLTKAAQAAPVATTDAMGDRLTETWLPDSAGGPHGGRAACQESVEYAATGLAAEGSACFWLTPTTFGVVTIYPMQNSSRWDFGYSGKQMDGFMLEVRAAAEQAG
jgi:hypothetical protein